MPVSEGRGEIAPIPESLGLAYELFVPQPRQSEADPTALVPPDPVSRVCE